MGIVFLALSLAAVWTSIQVANANVTVTPLVERGMSIDSYIHFLAKLNRVNEALARSIIRCESHGDPKAVHHNLRDGVEWSRDIGYFQLNSIYQGQAMLDLGWNIYDPMDNLQAGFYILKTQGTTPWAWSRPCWSKK